MNVLGMSYNEVEVTYTAGLAVVPPALKVACAQIVKNAQATPAMNVKGSKMDTLQMQYFAGSLIDANVADDVGALNVAQRTVSDDDLVSGASAGSEGGGRPARAMGGRTVMLRMPAPAVAADVTEQLGIATRRFRTFL